MTKADMAMLSTWISILSALWFLFLKKLKDRVFGRQHEAPTVTQRQFRCDGQPAILEMVRVSGSFDGLAKESVLSAGDARQAVMNVNTITFYAKLLNFEHLQKSLKVVLGEYPELAGSMGTSHDNQDKLCVVPGHGVLFSRCESDFERSDMEQSLISTNHNFTDAVAPLQELLSSASEPVMKVRLTALRSGGCTLAISINHAIVDGASYYQVLDTWKQAYNDIKQPQLSPTSTSLRHWNKRTFDILELANEQEQARLPSLALSLTRYLRASYIPYIIQKSQCIVRKAKGLEPVMLLLSPEALRQIKSKSAKRFEQYRNRVPDTEVEFLSTNDVVASMLAQHALQSPASLFLSISARGKVSSLPARYFGTSSFGYLLGKTEPWNIRQAVVQPPHPFPLCSLSKAASRGVVCVSNWSKFANYETLTFGSSRATLHRTDIPQLSTIPDLGLQAAGFVILPTPTQTGLLLMGVAPLGTAARLQKIFPCTQ